MNTTTTANSNEIASNNEDHRNGHEVMTDNTTTGSASAIKTVYGLFARERASDGSDTLSLGICMSQEEADKAIDRITQEQVDSHNDWGYEVWSDPLPVVSNETITEQWEADVFVGKSLNRSRAGIDIHVSRSGPMGLSFDGSLVDGPRVFARGDTDDDGKVSGTVAVTAKSAREAFEGLANQLTGSHQAEDVSSEPVDHALNEEVVE